MYAVIETGGKQYRVEVGTELEVELLDAKAGDTISLDRVLLVADGDTTAIGRPVVADATVSAEVLRQERGDKIIAFKYRPKARRRVKKGHRQELHVLRIADIVLNGKSAAAAVRKAESDAKTERQRLEEAARRQAAEDAALAAKLAAAKTKAESAKAESVRARAAGTAPRPKARAKPTAAGKPSVGTRPKAAAEAGEREQAVGAAGSTAKAKPKASAPKKPRAAKAADVVEPPATPNKSRPAKKDE